MIKYYLLLFRSVIHLFIMPKLLLIMQQDVQKAMDLSNFQAKKRVIKLYKKCRANLYWISRFDLIMHRWRNKNLKWWCHKTPCQLWIQIYIIKLILIKLIILLVSFNPSYIHSIHKISYLNNIHCCHPWLISYQFNQYTPKFLKFMIQHPLFILNISYHHLYQK